MIKVIGKIQKVGIRSVSIEKFRYENFMAQDHPYNRYRTTEENLYFFYGPQITARFTPEVTDDLIRNAGKLCSMKIEQGIISSVEPFKSESLIITEFNEKWHIKED